MNNKLFIHLKMNIQLQISSQLKHLNKKKSLFTTFFLAIFYFIPIAAAGYSEKDIQTDAKYCWYEYNKASIETHAFLLANGQHTLEPALVSALFLAHYPKVLPQTTGSRPYMLGELIECQKSINFDLKRKQWLMQTGRVNLDKVRLFKESFGPWHPRHKLPPPPNKFAQSQDELNKAIDFSVALYQFEVENAENAQKKINEMLKSHESPPGACDHLEYQLKQLETEHLEISKNESVD